MSILRHTEQQQLLNGHLKLIAIKIIDKIYELNMNEQILDKTFKKNVDNISQTFTINYRITKFSKTEIFLFSMPRAIKTRNRTKYLQTETLNYTNYYKTLWLTSRQGIWCEFILPFNIFCEHMFLFCPGISHTCENHMYL